MIDPSENVIRIAEALRTLRDDTSKMNAENYNNIVTQARHIQDLAWQIERWAIPKSDVQDDIATSRGWQSWHEINNSIFNLLRSGK